MKRLFLLSMLASMIVPMAGCVVEPARPAPAYRCVWVPQHYNAYGQFVPGHCRP